MHPVLFCLPPSVLHTWVLMLIATLASCCSLPPSVFILQISFVPCQIFVFVWLCLDGLVSSLPVSCLCLCSWYFFFITWLTSTLSFCFFCVCEVMMFFFFFFLFYANLHLPVSLELVPPLDIDALSSLWWLEIELKLNNRCLDCSRRQYTSATFLWLQVLNI